MSVFRDLFEKITERFSSPVKLSQKCESNTFYRVEDLSGEDIDYCAKYLASRILDAGDPEVLIEMPGSTLNLAEALSNHLSHDIERPVVITLEEFYRGNGKSDFVKSKNVVIINDVITTGRSCLEAHSKLTLKGANVLCWAALIDRTFGPGPVAVVATLTGEPVNLLG